MNTNLYQYKFHTELIIIMEGKMQNIVQLFFSESPLFTEPTQKTLAGNWNIKRFGLGLPTKDENVNIPITDPSISHHHFSLINNQDGIFIKPLADFGVFYRVKPNQRAFISSTPELYIGNSYLKIENKIGTGMLQMHCDYNEKNFTIPILTTQEYYNIGRASLMPIGLNPSLIDGSLGAINSRIICKRNSLEIIDVGTNIQGSSNGTWVRVPHMKFFKVKNSMQFRFGAKAYLKIKIFKCIMSEVPKVVSTIKNRCFVKDCNSSDFMCKFSTCSAECPVRVCKAHKGEVYIAITIQNIACPVCGKIPLPPPKELESLRCVKEDCEETKVFLKKKMKSCKDWCSLRVCESHMRAARRLMMSVTNCPKCNVLLTNDDKITWDED